MKYGTTLRLLISNLSGRRKMALLAALALVGAGISDPDFLRESDDPMAVHGAGHSPGSFDEIEAMLAEFETEKPRDSSLALIPEVPEAPEDTEQSLSSLTIPEPARSGLSVQSVSYPEEPALSIPGTPVREDVPETPESAISRDVSVSSASPHDSAAQSPRIRLTGSIFPSP